MDPRVQLKREKALFCTIFFSLNKNGSGLFEFFENF